MTLKNTTTSIRTILLSKIPIMLIRRHLVMATIILASVVPLFIYCYYYWEYTIVEDYVGMDPEFYTGEFILSNRSDIQSIRLQFFKSTQEFLLSNTSQSQSITTFEKLPCTFYPDNSSFQFPDMNNLTDIWWNTTTYDVTLRKGGWREPVDCEPWQHVAIIIPFRDRLQHLNFLLGRLHEMLRNQPIAYRIFVAEQSGKGLFNKGRVMNIAFSYVQEHHPIFNCTIFHDVDMIPEMDSNIYMCGDLPTHLSPAVNEMNYTLPYNALVGGVLAMPSEHMYRLNGYSNMYYGWGGEDDDIYYRMEAENITVGRPPNEIGRYSMLPHQKQKATPGKIRYKLVWSAKRRYKTDGLAQLNKLAYTIKSVTEKNAYTHLMIDVGKRIN